MRHAASVPILGLAAVLTGCGGGSSGGAAVYSIGGSISGLSGTLVLENDGGDTMSSTADGPFRFSDALRSGSVYDVTVAMQPAGELCSVTNGSGMVHTTVTDVAIVCTAGTAVTAQWTWRSGSDVVNAAGAYGTQGTAAASNAPGARQLPTAWTDAAGHFWLFGGYGADSGGNFGLLGDLWEYSPSAGQWVWEGGSDTEGAGASYGSLGTASGSNEPGAREGAASWTDAAGNLWLFGGNGASGQNSEDFNDLWEYNLSSAQWTWMSGSNTADSAGSYGTLGVPAAGNVPPARTAATTWVDSSGMFWLFGGAQLSSTGSMTGVLNDLWSYNPTTGWWTWVGGSNTPNAAGVYGTQGAAAASNQPGARMAGSVWVDANGNVWLFGGLGLNSSGVSQELNDLWEYNPSTNEWTWVGGADTPDATGVYGTLGAGSAGNGPGARAMAVTWKDGSGNFWLFGGYGYDQLGDASDLNDLWEYNPAKGVWTWVGGASNVDVSGTYGTEGMAAGSNVPGAREQAIGWPDSSGNFWLFGGYGYDSSGNLSELNDLWSVTPGP